MELPPTLRRVAAGALRWRAMQKLLQLAVLLLAPRHRVGVNVICRDSQGRILLLHHLFHPHIPWGLPGGWLSPGERPQDGALRELREETGLEAVLGDPVFIDRSPLANHIEIIFEARVESEAAAQARPQSGEINALAWFRPDELPARLTNSTRLALDRVLDEL